MMYATTQEYVEERNIVLSNLLFGVVHSTNEDISTVYAAKYWNIGLTAYGDSRDEAITNLHKALHIYVQRLFEKGTLWGRLAQAGVQWYWEQDIPGWVSPPEANGSPESVSEKVPVH